MAMERSSATEPTIEQDNGGSFKQLRLAVVCYGGVSLAIYMHGVTKEIHKLVTASMGFERSPLDDPFKGLGTESVYWNALKELQERQGVPTRVVVDIVSGTSAGGINGVFLAKALAANLSQDALRDIWMDRGDLRQLIPSPLPTLPLKAATWLAKSAGRRLAGKQARPPLDGDRMLRWLREALDRMDSGTDPVPLPEVKALVPEGEILQLFVTATDLTGYTRWVWSYSPKQVPDLWHRHVFEFSSTQNGHIAGGRFTDTGSNLDLAFAARTTSCFPGAFAPISVREASRVLKAPSGWPNEFADRFLRIYQLSRADIFGAHFIDGGVLDNFPFGLAIEAIARKPARTEVDRRLLYVEPDPMVPTILESRSDSEREARGGSVPGMIKTVWSGLSTIPRHEPIVNDLNSVRDRNERVDAVAEIINTAKADVTRQVNAVLGVTAPAGGDWDAFNEANRAISEQAAEEAGFTHVTYVRVKLRSVVDRMADVAASISGFPKDSTHAAFVRRVIDSWAGGEGYLESSGEPTKKQLDFVQSFDLEYRERRIRFAVKRVNELYGSVDGRTERPFRPDLDAAKGSLWQLIVRLQRTVESIRPGTEGRSGEIAQAVRQAFDAELISESLSADRAGTMDDAVRSFVKSAAGRLNDIRDRLRDYFREELKTFGTDAFSTFNEAIEGWAEDIQADMRVRYFGYPYWDRLIYPLQYVSGITELNRIEVIRLSPADVRALGECSAKDKLKGVAKGHFGAFFERKYRENDYLWGRLDGAERLLWLLFDSAGDADAAAPFYPKAFRAILDEEKRHLHEIDDVFAKIERVLSGEIAAFPDCTPPGRREDQALAPDR